MKGIRALTIVLCFAVLLLAAVLAPAGQGASAAQEKRLVYDEAGLLSPADAAELTALAAKYGAKRETDFIIFTSKNEANADVVKMTEDFYDSKGPGYDQAHGNAVILTMDMRNREVYLAGFYKGKTYLDDGRLDKIRTRITPSLSAGDYRAAFETYLDTANRYMGIRPGVNPDNILFQLWFQLAASLGLGALVVGIMAYHSGGRVTVNSRAYEDSASSGIMDREDQYLRTTVTKTKIPRNTGGGGGGGGGTSAGGHSHSGSRGSF